MIDPEIKPYSPAPDDPCRRHRSKQNARRQLAELCRVGIEDLGIVKGDRVNDQDPNFIETKNGLHSSSTICSYNSSVMPGSPSSTTATFLWSKLSKHSIISANSLRSSFIIFFAESTT